MSNERYQIELRPVRVGEHKLYGEQDRQNRPETSVVYHQAGWVFEIVASNGEIMALSDTVYATEAKALEAGNKVLGRAKT